MKLIKRSQIGKSQGIDTTVRASIPYVSPDWDHVMRLKHNQITEEQYKDWYLDRLRQGLEDVYRWVSSFDQKEITFLCYCKDGKFCHTYLLIDFLITNWPEEFKRSLD